jgi:hypothetical protein
VDDLLESKLSRLLLVRAAQKVLKTLRVNTGEPSADTADEAFASEAKPEVLLKSLMAATEAEYAIYKKGGRRSISHIADHYDIDIALHPTGESSRVKIALMEAVLRKAKRTAEEKGTRLLVLIQPSVIDVTHGNARLTATYLSQFNDYRRERLTSVIDEICARNQIDRINLFPIFTHNNPDSLYFKIVDGHWNDAGQDLEARETANWIHFSLRRLGGE